MILYWWYCCHCGYHTDNKPELSWAEADRDWHISQNHRDDQWGPGEVSVSHYHFRHIEEGHLS